MTALIGRSVSQVELGTTLADQTGRTMDEIVSSVRRVTDIMAAIAEASKAQTAGIEHINDAIAQMDLDTPRHPPPGGRGARGGWGGRGRGLL
ncbi:methyl-accepting chemotaxis protein, partial [Massilia sp. CT11-108]|uniref:methyl-accepting chemotaxis protein n=1 Tax=Massilia sp. CT11-108 TaxID=3393900 RepID=UPI0039A65B08